MARGVLFVHNNFPAQFRTLAQTLVARGVPVYAIGAKGAPGLDGVRLARCALIRGTTEGILPLAVRAEADMIRGRSALNGALAMKKEGFEPTVIIGHPGWGETLFLAEVWPEAKQLLFSEFFYKGRDSDIDFDPEFSKPTDESRLVARSKNAAMSYALAQADVLVAPTEFQASLLPRIFREQTQVIHEGIDVDAIRPGPAEPFVLPDGRVIAPGAPVITHVNNKLEPLRGLHIFLRALPRLLKEVPNAEVLIFGNPTKSGYGGAAPDGLTWKDVCMRGLEDKLTPDRVHFMGRVPLAKMHAGMRLGAAHVYYSYPFVLSWSLVEAMALGCNVIGSDTAPLRDAIDDGVNGTLLPFFDVDALSLAMIDACRNTQASVGLRAAAREKAVAKFDSRRGTAAWLRLIVEAGMPIPGVSRTLQY
ncbi:glycosyltransferase [Phenylobacterium immobile]|uniref:glycosyltransferase n=1 Tax=Phenylobacterium immobile TaxID=21 RepID=UPI000AC7C9BE|nr:glycosyltransferase [Phenylobacterium immobile]